MIPDREDFNPLFGEPTDTSLLPREEMRVAGDPINTNREQIFVGIQYVRFRHEVRILLGNFATVIIPADLFPEMDEFGNRIEFYKPKVEDYGFVAKLGEYNVTFSDIL